MCVSKNQAYRHFRHPDGFGLLVADLIFQTLVPSVRAGLHVNACWKGSGRENIRRRCKLNHKAWPCSEESMVSLIKLWFCPGYQRRGGCSVSSV